MRLRRGLAAAATLLLLTAACADDSGGDAGGAGDQSSSTGASDHGGELATGTTWRLRVPDGWNGTLLLYSHGAVARGNPNPARVAQDDATARALLDRGYALAGGSYRDTGWVVQHAVEDQLDVLDAVLELIDEPARTIAWGSSLGGLVTLGLVEAHPERFDGGAVLCGVLAGSELFYDNLLDLAFVVQTLAAPGLAIADLPGDGSASLQVFERVRQRAATSAPDLARLALAAAIANVPAWSTPGEPPPTGLAGQHDAVLDNLGLIGPAISTRRAEIEATFGGNPSTNVGTDYTALLAASPTRSQVVEAYRRAGLDLAADLATLASQPRVPADAAARRRLAEALRPTGEIEDPVLSLATTGDPVLPGWHTTVYADLTARAGTDALWRATAVARAGHCTFTVAEQAVALESLLERVTTGAWPDLEPAALARRAEALGSAGAVRPDPYGQRAPVPQSAAFVDAPQPPLPRGRPRP